jgi:hypothetical protein
MTTTDETRRRRRDYFSKSSRASLGWFGVDGRCGDDARGETWMRGLGLWLGFCLESNVLASRRADVPPSRPWIADAASEDV